MRGLKDQYGFLNFATYNEMIKHFESLHDVYIENFKDFIKRQVDSTSQVIFELGKKLFIWNRSIQIGLILWHIWRLQMFQMQITIVQQIVSQSLQSDWVKQKDSDLKFSKVWMSIDSCRSLLRIFLWFYEKLIYYLFIIYLFIYCALLFFKLEMNHICIVDDQFISILFIRILKKTNPHKNIEIDTIIFKRERLN